MWGPSKDLEQNYEISLKKKIMWHVESTLRNSECIIKKSFIRDALQANILKKTLKEKKKN